MVLHDLDVLPLGRRRVVVRVAEDDDHDAIREVLRLGYREYEALLPAPVWSRYLADLLDLETHAAKGRLVVAELDGRVRGYGAFYPDISTQGLGWPQGWAGGRGLAVDPSARGHGLASALLNECEQLARDAGAPVFAFHSAGFMTSAIALYEQLGYRRAPEFDMDLNSFYGVPGSELTIIAFRRDLAVAAGSQALEPRTAPR